jgi:hypothetical protein
LEAYEKETKKCLRSHPLFTHLQSCHSPDAILSLLKGQFQGLNRSQISNERLTRWLNVTVNVLLGFSATLGEGTGLVSPKSRALSQFFPDPSVISCFRRQKRYLLASVFSLSQAPYFIL